MQKLKVSKLALLLSLGTAISTSAFIANAQSSSSTTTQAPSVKAAKSISDKDVAFVKEASEAGLAEVEMGKLAEKKASAENVRQFAGQMVKDHTEANDKLKKIAESKGLQTAAGLNAKHQKALTKLEGLKGEEFDKAYMKSQREDHKKAVSLFKKQSEKGADPDLKNFAATTLATLEDHKKKADDKPEKTATN